MRTFDLAPLYRSTVGFDRLFQLAETGCAELFALQRAAPGR